MTREYPFSIKSKKIQLIKKKTLILLKGQELLVWYGDSYLQFLGIPVSLKDMTDEMNEETAESKLNFIKTFPYVIQNLYLLA